MLGLIRLTSGKTGAEGGGVFVTGSPEVCSAGVLGVRRWNRHSWVNKSPIVEQTQHPSRIRGRWRRITWELQL